MEHARDHRLGVIFMPETNTITTPDNSGSQTASTVTEDIVETLRSAHNIALGMAGGTLLADEVDWQRLAARLGAQAELVLVARIPARPLLPKPMWLSPMTGPDGDYSSLPQWEGERTGDSAIVEAARELARGGEARFALVRTHPSRADGWTLNNVARFGVLGNDVRVHHSDGDPCGSFDQENAPIGLLYTFEAERSVPRDTARIATRLAQYLTQYKLRYVRLSTAGRRLA
jgi:hypothetical protein